MECTKFPPPRLCPIALHKYAHYNCEYVPLQGGRRIIFALLVMCKWWNPRRLHQVVCMTYVFTHSLTDSVTQSHTHCPGTRQSTKSSHVPTKKSESVVCFSVPFLLAIYARLFLFCHSCISSGWFSKGRAIPCALHHPMTTTLYL